MPLLNPGPGDNDCTRVDEHHGQSQHKIGLVELLCKGRQVQPKEPVKGAVKQLRVFRLSEPVAHKI